MAHDVPLEQDPDSPGEASLADAGAEEVLKEQGLGNYPTVKEEIQKARGDQVPLIGSQNDPLVVRPLESPLKEGEDGGSARGYSKWR